MRFIKYLLILILFTILFLGLGLFLLRDKITGYLINEITVQSAKKNLNVHFGSPQLVPFAFKSGELSLRYFYKILPLQVDLENLLIKPDLGAMFDKKLQTDLSFDLLGGDVKAKISGDDNKISLPELVVRNVDLAKHRQIRPLGLASGRLSLQAKDIESDGSLTSIGQVDVQLEDVKMPYETVLPTWATGLPIALKLPPILAESLEMRLEATDFGYRMSLFDLDSDLGDLDCLASLKGKSKPVLETLSCDAALTKDGLKHLSDWISLLSSGKVKNQQRFSFDLKMSSRGLPNMKFMLPESLDD